MAGGYKMAFGLDASGGQWAVAKTGRKGEKPVLATGAPESPGVRKALDEAAREVGRGRAALSVAAPAAQTIVRRLRAPFASAKKAAKVWPSILDVELPFPVEGAACHYGPSRVEGGETRAVSAAIRKADLAGFVERSRAGGIEPTHCDAEALALWDQLGFEAPAARAGHPRALAWLGTDHATVARGRGGDIWAVHVLRLAAGSGAGGFEAAWGARMGPILAAHLGETGAGEMDLWWAGPGAEDAEWTARLRQALPPGLAVRHETVRQPGGMLARALARRAAAGTGANFLAGEFAHAGTLAAEGRSLRRAWGGTAAAAVLALALAGAERIQTVRMDAAMQRRIVAAAEEIVGGPVTRKQELRDVELALARRDEETRPFRFALDSGGVEALLDGALEETAALGVEISGMVLKPAALALEGTAPGAPAIEALAERLRARGWTVHAESAGRGADGRARFALKGTRADEG